MSNLKLDEISVLNLKIEPQKNKPQQHDYYEFIFFKSGKGIFFNNNLKSNFEAGDLFLVKPKELHFFECISTSEIYSLRFGQTGRLMLKELINNLNDPSISLSKIQSPVNLKVHFSENEFNLMLSIFDLMHQLFISKPQNENLCFYQILCMIALIERNLSYQSHQKKSYKDKPTITKILAHIHKNLKTPSLLTLSYMATKFNMSKNTLGNYFKKQMGESPAKYIQHARNKIIEKMVSESELSFSEITFQLGFVDESHFAKYFRKQFNANPTEYRKLMNVKHQDSID